MFHLQDYVFETNNRNGKRGGGTGIYIHKSVQYNVRLDLTKEYVHFESLFIEISCKGKNRLIGIIYRPPHKSIDGFIEEITHLFNNISINKYDCSSIGDFNLDLLKISQNSKVDAFIDSMLSYSFHPLINAPTRITSTLPLLC